MKTWESVDRMEYTEKYLEQAYEQDTFQTFSKGEIDKIKSLIPIEEELGNMDAYEDILRYLDCFTSEEFYDMTERKKVLCFSRFISNSPQDFDKYSLSSHLVIFKDEDDYFLVLHHYELFNSQHSKYVDFDDVKCDQMRGLSDYLRSDKFKSFLEDKTKK
jgi:hypothetical protein